MVVGGKGYERSKRRKEIDFFKEGEGKEGKVGGGRDRPV